MNRSILGRFFEWSKMDRVKGVVDFPIFRKVQSIRQWSKDFLDLERSFVFRSDLLVVRQSKIPGV